MSEIIGLVFPLFIIILLGYLAAKFRLLDKNTGGMLCSYLFSFSLPFLTFANIYRTGLDNLLNLNFILAVAITISLIILTSFLFFTKVFKLSGSELILAVFGSYYVNATYMGMPVSTMIVGTVTPPLIILVLQAGLLFPPTLYMLDRNTSQKTNLNLKDSLLILVKNPLMIAAASAVIALAIGIQLPDFVHSALNMLGQPASTVGLFALGYTCYLPADSRFTKTEIRYGITVTLFKLILHPLIAFVIGKFLIGLDPHWLRALIVVAMLPTALNHFIATQKYNVFRNESKLIILFTTFGFILTISLFLLII